MSTPDVDSFYHLHDEAAPQGCCRGLACFAARAKNPSRWAEAVLGEPRHYCLGFCYAAPSQAGDTARPLMKLMARESVVMGNLLAGGAITLERYLALGGYASLPRALTMPPAEVVAMIEASGLRGRGGAGYPTGRKWRAVQQVISPRKFVVANADEGDAGAYIDRFLLEDDPFLLIEAMTIAAYAVGATEGFVYLRREYSQAWDRFLAALAEARTAGWLGAHIAGRDFVFDIQLVRGEGSYVCGEETAMLNAIEGRRPEVRMRPPYPTHAGLFGAPTLIGNVETLACVPWIVREGADHFHSMGFSTSRGAIVLSLNSLFNRPGLYEVEFGITLSEIVYRLGGGLRSGSLSALLIGGPLAGLLPPSHLDTRLGYEEMQTIGASVGHGGVVAFDETLDIAALLAEVFAFGAYESCGKCTPCHLGSPQLARLWARAATGEKLRGTERLWMIEVLDALAATSFCGHGSGLAALAMSVLRYFPAEVDACFA